MKSHSRWINYKGSRLRVHDFRDHAYLECLFTEYERQGKGDATRLLILLTRWAKKHKIRMVLFVGPFNNKPLDTPRLVQFYEKYGFKVLSDYEAPFATNCPWMEYRP